MAQGVARGAHDQRLGALLDRVEIFTPVPGKLRNLLPGADVASPHRMLEVPTARAIEELAKRGKETNAILHVTC